MKRCRQTAYVSLTVGDFTFVFAECFLDPRELEKFAKKFAAKFNGVAFATLNHDDDVLLYWLYKGKKRIDAYCSNPDWFEEEEEDIPEGGDAEKLAETFDVMPSAGKLQEILSGDYVFAVERHWKLAEILRIDPHLSTVDFEYIDHENLPDDLHKEMFVESGFGPAVRTRKKLDHITMWKQQVQEQGLLLAEFKKTYTRRSKQRAEMAPYWCIIPSHPGIFAVWSGDYDLQDSIPVEYYAPPWKNPEQTTLKLLNPIHPIQVSTSARYLAVVGGQGRGNWFTEIWNIKSGESLLQVPHAEIVNKVAFLHNERKVLSVSMREIVLSSVQKTLKRLALPQGDPRGLTIHPSDQYAVIGNGRRMVVIDLSELTIIKDVFFKEGNQQFTQLISSVLFNSDGTQLYAATTAGICGYRFQDILAASEVTPKPMFIVSPEQLPRVRADQHSQAPATLFGFVSDWIIGSQYHGSIAFDPQRKVLLFSNSGTIGYLNPADGKSGILLTSPLHPAMIPLMEISSDGKALLFTCGLMERTPSSSLQIWDYMRL